MKQSILVRGCLTLGFVSLVLFAGCWMSKVTLIEPSAAKVNLAFVGNWNNPEQFDATGREAGLVIRNIDNRLYYVEWKSKGGSPLVRGVGFTAEVGGATFAHLRGLEDDGKLEDQWLICRVELSGDKLTIRQLREEFFKSRTVDSPAALRQVLEQNLNNAAMYDETTNMTVTKARP